MSRSNRPSVTVGKHWARPASKVYNYNFNFQEGYYKPMIDHLDSRDRGSTEPPPGAQTFAERCAKFCPGCLSRHKPGEHTLPIGNRPGYPSRFPSSDFPELSDLDPPPRRHRPSLDDDPDAGPGKRRPKLKLPDFDDLANMNDPDLDALLDMEFPRRKPKGFSTPQPDDATEDPFLNRPKRKLKMPNLDDMLEDAGLGPRNKNKPAKTPDFDFMLDEPNTGSKPKRLGFKSPDIDSMMEDAGFGPKGRRNRSKTPDIDGLLKEMGINGPMFGSKKGNRTPNANSDMESPFSRRSALRNAMADDEDRMNKRHLRLKNI